MTSKKIKGIIYDLDGTLVDSAPDIARAVNYALSKRGLPQLPVPVVARLVGTGGRNVCYMALCELGQDADDDLVEEIYQEFFAFYKEHPVVETKPYPGTVAGLVALRDVGYVQGICTNKTAAVTELVLAGLELAQYFDVVIGGDATPKHKPAPEHLLHVMRELGLQSDQIVYVGDTAIDLQTAKKAGVRYFAVEWASQAAHEKGFSESLSSIADLLKIL